MKYNSVLDTIGNTPIIRINRLAPKHVQLYVKTESPLPWCAPPKAIPSLRS